MADKLSRLEYDDVLRQSALDAAKARVKAYNQVNKELSPDAAEDMEKKYYFDFVSKLQKAYPYENVSRDDLSAIKNYDSNKMQAYLYQFGSPNATAESPTKYEKSIKAAEIFPLLQGVAKEGKDWMSLPNDSLKAFGLNHKYNVKTKEGFADLLKDIGEQQINYDRARIAQEAKDSLGWTYTPRKVITPSAMQEFENAIMTGGDYDASTAAKMGALDALTNAATWEAPGIRYVKGDIANGILGAMVQAVSEAGRQGGEVALSNNGQEFDVAPVLFAGTAGATRPALVGAIQQKAGQIPGETARQFSRGVSKATRANDPVAAERETLKKTLETYNKLVSKVRTLDEASKSAANTKNVATTGATDVYAKLAATNNIPEISKLFNVPLKKNFTIDANKVLAQYDKPTVTTFGFDDAGKVVLKSRPKNGFVNTANVTPDAIVTKGEMKLVNSPNNIYEGSPLNQTSGGVKQVWPDHYELDATTDPLYAKLFPNRHAELMAGSPSAFKNGYRVGTAASVLGGRIEPTFKLGSDYTPKYKKTYKDEKWYQDLNVRSKKIIDEAFKKKKEEESEEE